MVYVVEVVTEITLARLVSVYVVLVVAVVVVVVTVVETHTLVVAPSASAGAWGDRITRKTLTNRRIAK
jgi:hypothetical protein